jgi:hypothetical protein
LGKHVDPSLKAVGRRSGPISPIQAISVRNSRNEPPQAWRRQGSLAVRAQPAETLADRTVTAFISTWHQSNKQGARLFN